MKVSVNKTILKNKDNTFFEYFSVKPDVKYFYENKRQVLDFIDFIICKMSVADIFPLISIERYKKMRKFLLKINDNQKIPLPQMIFFLIIFLL